MKKKYILTESQFDKLIKDRTKDILKEGNTLLYEQLLEEELLEEGLKDWALAGLMLLATLGGVKAQRITPMDSTHIKAAELVQKKLDRGDEDMLKLFDDADIELNKQNLEKLKSVSKRDFDKAKVSTYKAKSLGRAKSKLKSGYAITDIKITNDTILPGGTIITFKDTLDLGFNSDNFFITAGYDLTNQATNEIRTVISDIQQNNGQIVNVTIESSTDTEPIKMGNQKLAQLRAESIANILDSMGIDSIDINTKPEQGPDVYSRTMSKEERTEARKQTAPYRYVKLKITYLVDVETPGGETYPEVKTRYEIEMVKLDRIGEVPGKAKTKKKFGAKCHKIQLGGEGNGTACPANLDQGYNPSGKYRFGPDSYINKDYGQWIDQDQV
jgi:outer membrane protein OmpA-like peptidoglycan-associated protein